MPTVPAEAAGLSAGGGGTICSSSSLLSSTTTAGKVRLGLGTISSSLPHRDDMLMEVLAVVADSKDRDV